MNKSLKKTALLIVLILSIFFSNFSKAVYAQSEEETPDNRYFDIEVEIETQSIWNKTIPIIVKFTPKMNSEKTEISWDYTEGIEIEPLYQNFFPTKEDETVAVRAIIYPSYAGKYSIGVNVTSWSGFNYTNSERFYLELDENLELKPIQVSYQSQKTARTVIILILSVSTIISLFFVLKKLMPKFQAWLKPDIY